MATETSWLIGSTYIPDTDIGINGTHYQIPAGHYYLSHPDTDLSLVDQVRLLMLEEGIVAGANILRNRRVRLSANDAFTIEWTDPNLRYLLGFFADLIGSTTATYISPLLWSPGRTETPLEAPLGCLGRNVYDTVFGTSPSGVQVADSHHTQIVNTFAWTHVSTRRYQTNAGLASRGGEFTIFYDSVLRKAQKFHHWRLMVEDDESSTPVSWTTSLGPYGYRPGRGGMTWDFTRSPGHTQTNLFSQVSIDCLVVPEWDNG